ncbi:MAG: glycosyltransferase family 4 protein [Planctomycetota bacterium]|jgi:glycosyltransferase involved in cell wall biosynthesis
MTRLGYNSGVNKKIAIIIERADIALGGAERSVFELAAALKDRGLQVHMLAAKGQTNAENIHFLCHHTPGKRACFYTFSHALKKHLAGSHYDIVHSVLPFPFADIYQPRGGSFAESIVRNAASYQNPLMAHYKKITAFANHRRTILLYAERRLCKNAAGPVVVTLSNYVHRQFNQHYGLDDRRIVVIPNGVKTNKKIDAAKTGKLRAQIMAQLGIQESNNPVFFLFVANNFRLKGLAVLIEAMRLPADSDTRKPAYLIVAGGGRTHRYRRLAKQLDVDKRIIFLGPVRHIQNALSIADVAVLPTFYDPASRFTLEALAAAKPVITTRFNGATDLFVNNRHGRVIDDPEDVSSLAQAIIHFTDTNNARTASDAIVADKISDKVSITRVAEQLDSLYEQILQERTNK